MEEHFCLFKDVAQYTNIPAGKCNAWWQQAVELTDTNFASCKYVLYRKHFLQFYQKCFITEKLLENIFFCLLLIIHWLSSNCAGWQF